MPCIIISKSSVRVASDELLGTTQSSVIFWWVEASSNLANCTKYKWRKFSLSLQSSDKSAWLVWALALLGITVSTRLCWVVCKDWHTSPLLSSHHHHRCLNICDYYERQRAYMQAWMQSWKNLLLRFIILHTWANWRKHLSRVLRNLLYIF